MNNEYAGSNHVASYQVVLHLYLQKGTSVLKLLPTR